MISNVAKIASGSEQLLPAIEFTMFPVLLLRLKLPESMYTAHAFFGLSTFDPFFSEFADNFRWRKRVGQYTHMSFSGSEEYPESSSAVPVRQRFFFLRLRKQSLLDK